MRTLLVTTLLATTTVAAQAQSVSPGDWRSYNRSLTSERFSPLSQITGENVGTLREACSYDTGLTTSF